MGRNQNFIEKKLGLSWAKLKFSLVRVVDEVTVIFNLVEGEIEVTVELSLLVLVGGGWVEEKKMKLMLYSTQLYFKLKFELSLAILQFLVVQRAIFRLFLGKKCTYFVFLFFFKNNEIRQALKLIHKNISQY